MKMIFVSWTGFALTAPLLLYAAYGIRRDRLRLSFATLRLLKWIAISLPLSVAVNVAFLFRFWSAPVVVAITAPILVYIAYTIWRDGLGWRLGIQRLLKWTAVSLPVALLISAVIFVGVLALLAVNSCDDMMISPVVANARGDRAQGRLQACSFFGASDNYYITLEIENQLSLWPRKKLIDYDPAGDLSPVLRWTDENTLSIDLGKVYEVSTRLNQVGSVHITYTYSVVDDPYKSQY